MSRLITVALLHNMAFVCLSLQSATFSRPYHNHPTCPRQPDRLAEGRHCLKKCLVDDDCRGVHKRCLCDDVCGKSCIKPSLRCRPIEAIEHGRVELLPGDTFGSVARYTCDSGYVLTGRAERRCQADRSWSGVAPICATEDSCKAPPVVPNAHSEYQPIFPLTYNIGSQYPTHDHLKAYRTLLRSQTAPAVTVVRPPGPAVTIFKPPGAEIGLKERENEKYAFGTQFRYRCEEGYVEEGLTKALCVGEGRWAGPRMRCNPRRCENPGTPANGIIEGEERVFGSMVWYHCKKGYRMVGLSQRHCMANGTWSGELPKCILNRCPPLKPPPNGLMYDVDFSYGSTVRFNCTDGYSPGGDTERHCRADGTWTGEPLKCLQNQCESLMPFYGGTLRGYERTIASVVTFICLGSTKLVGSPISTCKEDGTWSHPKPFCAHRCQVPEVGNGTLQSFETVGGYMTHGLELKFSCDEGFVAARQPNTGALGQEEKNGAVVCYNGTWSMIPTCKPSRKPCMGRPPDLKDGFFRFVSIDHGAQVRYECDQGFNFSNETHLLPYTIYNITCDDGKWPEVKLHCSPNSCKYPGTIDNGEIQLVGVIGKYEYRSYVRNVRHNDQIEYKCAKYYRLSGPPGSTCIQGHWSPSTNSSVCVPQEYPDEGFRAHSRESSKALTLNRREEAIRQKIRENWIKTWLGRHLGK